ncbi:MAG: hypothetical protein A2Z29_11305 [Chloroflexi bacterium RBG_16_56_11]|nr:MAG: hypothetical protein A2Z29_11305 [Chloroflexi bacterium RBG_16_56_11]
MESVRLVVKPAASRLISKVSRLLTEEGTAAYLVGGFVRDILLGRDTADIDIAIAGDATGVARRMAAALGGKYIPLDEQNGVYRVVPPDSKWQIDFTRLEGDIRHDLRRRDFTINAMALALDNRGGPVTAEGLIDPCQGLEDLRRRELKAVRDGAFRADAARLLRAVRIAAELDFDIESSTESLITRDAGLITGVAGERTREELLRILAISGAGGRLIYLDNLGLLTALIPEMARARGVAQPVEHTWDVFEHSIQTVGATEFLLREGPWEYGIEEVLATVPWSLKLSEHFDESISSGSTRRTLLKLAALFHDIAKPQTKSTEADGRVRFLGHPTEGATAASIILERMRFSNREIKLVELLVRYHLRPTQMSQEGLPTARAIYRFFRDTGEVGTDVLFLSLADHLAARGPQLDLTEWQRHTAVTGHVLAEREAAVLSPHLAPLLDGHEIMKALGISPGPKVGKLLEAVKEAQASGEISDRQGALNYAKQRLADANISENEGV